MDVQWFFNLLLATLTVVINGAVTYGVVKTQLAWLRADIVRHESTLERHQEELSKLWGRRATDSALRGAR